MNFKQRLFRYLIGVGIGCLLVFVIFPKYDWLGWTPQKRLMEFVREAKWQYSPSGKCSMECNNKTNDDFDQARFHGKINFEMSDVHSSPKRYQLEHEKMTYQILVNDTLVTLIEAKLEGGVTCMCP